MSCRSCGFYHSIFLSWQMFSPSCLCHVTIYICVFSPNRGLNPKIITIKDWGTWNFKFLKPWKTMKFHGKKLGFGGSSRYVLPHLPPIPATNPPLPCHRLRSARLPAAQCSGRGRRPAWRIQNHLYYVMICIYIYIHTEIYVLIYWCIWMIWKMFFDIISI